MSHVATVKLKVKDLDALEAACKELGLELVKGQQTYRWYGKWVKDYHDPEKAAYLNGFKPEDFGKCEHAIRIPDNPRAYEIGLTRDQDGDLALIYDNYQRGHGLEAIAGRGLGKLKQHYASLVAHKQLIKSGMRVVRNVVNGKVVLTGSK